MNPTAAVIIIGNEILSGRTVDANISHIARRLSDCGITMRECRIVRDEEAAIVTAVNELRKTYTYVFTTGGIGPTHDDITIPTIAKAFGVAVERNIQVESKLRENYGSTMAPASLRMADYPAGARIVWHGEQFAPGCMMENVIIMAGVPRIMQIMLEAVLPLLQQGEPSHTRQIDAWVSESHIAEGLEAIQNRFPDIDIGSYPYRIDGRPGTALVARGLNAMQVEEAFAAIVELLNELGAETRAA
ncbi:MAG: competence/damage-inducible protein A [Pseudomonas fluorescens]|nr:MAG: competence/damage-inducible protein A [Pseudomonas fluorescens]